jgi:Zn-dependent peptidase ImmA (M78 family)
MKRKDIEKRAKEILRDHNLLDIPVDPLTLAKALGIKVMNAKFSEPDKSGAIAKRSGITSIFLDNDDTPARKRFSIAHEIGHYLLHMPTDDDLEIVDKTDNFRSIPEESSEWTDDRRKEWEANIFAAALLMDEDLIRAEWLKSKDISKIAWRFQVSQSAVAIRLTSLGLINEFD